MIMVKKSQLLILGVLLCCSSLKAAEQPAPAKRELQFTASDEVLLWPDKWGRYVSKPMTHAAVFHLKNVRNWGDFRRVKVTLEANYSFRAFPKAHGSWQVWALRGDSRAERRRFFLHLPEGWPRGPSDWDDEELMKEEMLAHGGVPAKGPEDKATEIRVYGDSEEDAERNADVRRENLLARPKLATNHALLGTRGRDQGKAFEDPGD
jgi:hypothetical protein